MAYLEWQQYTREEEKISNFIRIFFTGAPAIILRVFLRGECVTVCD